MAITNPDQRFAALHDAACSMAGRNREPRRAWLELNSWAFGKGPAAMKAAIMGFIEMHGSRPESAAVFPEIARAASQLPPAERVAMLALANRSFVGAAGLASAPAPAAMVQMKKDRPAFSIAFHPKEKQKAGPAAVAASPSVQAAGIAHMLEARDSIFRVSEQLSEAGEFQKAKPGAEARPAPQLSAPLTSDSFKSVMKAEDGHALVRSLIAKVRSHGAESPYLAPSEGKAGPARKKAAKARRPRKAARKKAAKRTPARGRKSRRR